MPQLDPYIFPSQFGWFLLVFGFIYYLGIFPKITGICEFLWVKEKMFQTNHRKVIKPFLSKEEKIGSYGYGLNWNEKIEWSYKLKR
jgi:hypothetical protein